MTIRRNFLVAGKSRAALSWAPVTRPWDQSVACEVGQASASDVEEAVQGADAAFAAFSRTPTHERRTLLESVSRGLLERLDAFATAICEEAGKPVTLARAEVQRAAETFHLAAGEAERLCGEMVPVDLSPATEGYRCLVRPVPRGPVLAIGPFNFPLNLLAHKIAPALAVGAPVVVKPPPQSPSAALMLGELIVEKAPSTWPAGFISVLPCANALAGAMARDARFRVVSFTGSGPVGWHVRQMASRAHVVLELGGDAAVIVCEDADLEKAARRIAWGATAYAGQVCISVQRVFVQASVRDPFMALLGQELRRIPVGDPSDPATMCGPVIDDRAADRIADALGESGRVRVGGGRKGRMIEPTLVESPDDASAIAREELFGPAVAVWAFDNFEEALLRVDDSDFGLQAGLYTQQIDRILQAHDTIRVGGLVVNDVPTLRVDSYPYGGTKGSGIGREGGRAGLLEYTEPRVLLLGGGR